MAFKIKGVVVHVAEVKSGISKAGKEWKSVDFTIQHGDDDRFPKCASFTLFGEKTKYCPIEGEIVEVSFDIDARKWEERYFNRLNAFQVFAEKGEQKEYQTSPEPNFADLEDDKDDLPF